MSLRATLQTLLRVQNVGRALLEPEPMRIREGVSALQGRSPLARRLAHVRNVQVASQKRRIPQVVSRNL
jgi:hypothetical protein